MGKSSGDVSVDPSEVFPGLVTPSFSLLRSQRPGTRQVARGRQARGSGREAVPNLRGGFGPLAPRGGGQGPFVLDRRGPSDPFRAEGSILRALGANRRNLRLLRRNVSAGRRELRGIRSGIPGVFANTQDLRERNQALQEQVTPGFGRLTESQVRESRNREAAAQGNLREALSARRVLGSSFAQREQESLGREFAEQEESIRAESFLQEFGVQQNLINQAGQLIQLDQQTIAQQGALLGLEMGLTDQDAQILGRQFQTIQAQSQVLAQRAQRELQELAISGNIINGVTASATQLAGLQAQAAAEEAAGIGQLIGSIGGSIFGNFGGIFGK